MRRHHGHSDYIRAEIPLILLSYEIGVGDEVPGTGWETFLIPNTPYEER